MTPDLRCQIARWLPWAFALGLGGVLLLIASVSYGWTRAGTMPVKVCLFGATELDVRVGFEAESDPLPLIPVAVENGTYSWFWATELPPRPQYNLFLEFPEGLANEQVVWLRLTQLSPTFSELPEIPFTPDHWELTGGTWEPDGTAWRLEAAPGATLRAREVIERRPEGMSSWLGAIAALGVAGLVLIGLFNSGLHFPGLPCVSTLGHVEGWHRRNNAILATIIGLSGGGMFLVIARSMPGFWPADSTSYLVMGLQWLYHGNFQVGGYEFELNRLPGYAVFIAGALQLLGNDLKSVVLLQGGLAVFALSSVVWSLRRAVRPALLWPTAPLFFASPAIVWAQRQVATEGAFLSFVALAVLAWWEGMHARRVPVRWSWMACFVVFVMVAAFIRPNGVLLLALPGCLAVSAIWQAWQRHGWRVWRGADVGRGCVVLGIGALVVFGLLVAWAQRNAAYRGYHKPSDTTPIVWANAPFIVGFFDPAALSEGDEYETIITNRHNSGYFYHGWGYRRDAFVRITQNWAQMDRDTLPALSSALNEFAARNWAATPLPMWPAVVWRVIQWGWWLPGGVTYYPAPLVNDYRVETSPLNPNSFAAAQRNVAWAARSRGDKPPPAFNETEEAALIHSFNALVPFYNWIYRGLFVAGLAVFVMATWRRDSREAIFLLPFFLNFALNVFLLYVLGRYVQILDFLLLAGLLIWLERQWRERAPPVPLPALVSAPASDAPEASPAPC